MWNKSIIELIISNFAYCYGLNFFKTMSLLLSGLRDYSVRFREILPKSNRIQSANCYWWNFFPTVAYLEIKDKPTGCGSVNFKSTPTALTKLLSYRARMFRPYRGHSFSPYGPTLSRQITYIYIRVSLCFSSGFSKQAAVSTWKRWERAAALHYLSLICLMRYASLKMTSV